MAAQLSQQNDGQPVSEIPTDGKATTSMVLGILAMLLCFLGWLAGIPAIILGHISRSNIRKSMGRLKGDGMALAGLSMGYISVAATLCFLIVVVVVAIPDYVRSKMAVNESHAESTVRMISAAQAQYRMSYPDVGYAPDLASLGGNPCSAATAEHACLIAGTIADQSCTASHWCVKQGYRFMLQADEKHPLESFVVTAVPEKPESSGAKSFCGLADGEARHERAASPRTTGYTSEECAALTSDGA
jgi:hypothetical protein